MKITSINISEFNCTDITLLDSYYANITQKMVNFLNTFNPDKLLYNFRKTAGLPNKKASISYGGWENSRIGGHTMGHFLTAAAQAVARGYGNCKGPDGLTLEQRLSYLIDSLEECQNALGTGFIFGATMANPENPILQFEKLEKKDYNDTWVPWYTMHKILAGLVETYKQTKNHKALEIAEKLGEWIYNRTSAWTDEVRNNVICVEFGGMNDCLYELFKAAESDGYKNSEHFYKAAHIFDEEWLFSHVEAIVNRHANTTIPKFVGAANRSMILFEKGESEEAKKSLEYCKNFWEEVINHHTYITGGNSECEHFGLPDILDAERSNTNCETCNTYNMLKLSRMLFMMTGERKFADYYENTFLNAIMASVNSENAMTTYFQPMATGCFKTYCNPDVDKNFFWCCTGTGLENFTKLGDSFYFHDEKTLYVNMYVSSSIKWDEKNCTISQRTEIPENDKAEFVVKIDSAPHASSHFTVAFRIPDWTSEEFAAKLNGQEISTGAKNIAGGVESEVKIKNGYLYITREWQSNDKIELTLPMTIKAYGLQDSKGKTFGFKYGPVVLAAELGSDDNMKHGIVGVQCDVSANKIVCKQEMPLSGNYGGTSNLSILEGEILKIQAGTVEDFMKNPMAHFEQVELSQIKGGLENNSSLHFRLKDTDFPGDLIFSAYNRINKGRYGIYWVFVASSQEKEFELKSAYHPDESEIYIEGIGIGYGAQTEGNENQYPYLKEANSVADPHELTRFAKAGGYFSYQIAVKPGAKNLLVCTFLKSDNGKSICIKAAANTDSSDLQEKASEIAKTTLNYTGESEKYTLKFEIPDSIIEESQEEQNKDKKHIRISFSSCDSNDSARLCAPVKTVYKLKKD
ncbi:MAG: glycoside hydrolase family 127 protein [Treponema sp.]|nr:glycoside hydrolase family 127 protein [Treponema sp.]